MVRVLRIVLIAASFLSIVSATSLAGISTELGYGNATVVEDPDNALSRSGESMLFASAHGEWSFADDQWGIRVSVSGAGSDLSFQTGVLRGKAGLQYRLENIWFFVGPTWTSYSSLQSAKDTKLEGIEVGGGGQVDFTDSLHLQGSFSFSPLLEGFVISLPDPNLDTWFSGNISEYYLGLSYDPFPKVSILAGLGGWRVLDPVSQQRLVTVDYRRLGLEYSF